MFVRGQQIGPYTLINRIGRGGFGEVWHAERRTEIVTTQVAIKFPLKDSIDLESIKQEAKIWAKASGHPNILPIIEANIYDGHIVIISEYASDGSLLHRLSKGVMTIRDGIDMISGILSGLDFLHSRQIIHRDLKPENILLQGTTPRLADFGISRAMRTTTVISQVIGTPRYMAPEAFDGKRTQQTDIWSVGVILYLFLSGYFPFEQENSTDLLGAIVLKDPQPLPATIPESLKQVVSRALAKKPEDRYQTAGEMRKSLLEAVNDASSSDAMERFLPERIPISSSVVVTTGTPTNVASRKPNFTAQSAPQNRAKKKLLHISLVALPLLFLLILFGGASLIGIYILYSKTNVRSQNPPPNNGTQTQSAGDEDMYAPGKMKEVVSAFEKETGGGMKIGELYVHPNFVTMKAKDPRNNDNINQYTYRSGAIIKEPIRRVPPFDNDEVFFTFSEFNFDAISDIIKTAKEKAQSIKGAGEPSVMIVRILSSSKEIILRVLISGANQELYIEANSKGEIKKIEFN